MPKVTFAKTYKNGKDLFGRSCVIQKKYKTKIKSKHLEALAHVKINSEG
jgi:hypothetical protein